jgi:4-amino-4-deoxy-L-arabinose transferase-like glycosyltransferase
MHIAPPAPGPDRSLGSVPEGLLRRPRLALVLLCLLLWLPGFFTLPATDRDEARFAQASRQMVETGDPIRIRLGQEERNKKPAGIHWLQSASVHLVEATGIGDRTDIWAYRLPSLLGALLAVLATFHFGRALVGRRAALLGAGMLASCLVLAAEAHIAKTDAALLATVTGAMGLFGLAYLRPGGFTNAHALGFWLLLGLSVLLKGPIGLMVVALAGITLAVADRFQVPWLRALRPSWGVPLMVAAAAPWFVAIGIATEGRFFEQAVGGDLLSKIGSGEENHWGPPGLYLALFGITAFPAAWIVMLALPAVWRDRPNPPVRFLLAWIVPAWLVFEAAATKLPHYTMPMFPPLMLLGAAWAMDPLRRMPPRWWRWFAAFCLIGVASGLALLALAVPWWLGPKEVLVGGVLVVPAAALLVWGALSAARTGAWGRAALVSAVLAVPLYAALLEGVAPRLDALWIAPRLAAVVEARAPGIPAADIGIAGHTEPSVLFALGGEIALLPGGAEAARFLAEAPPGGRPRLAIVGHRAEAGFREAAQALGLRPQEIGTVTGFNYSRGRWVTLILYRGGPV